jgi:hypothetical protein
LLPLLFSNLETSPKEERRKKKKRIKTWNEQNSSVRASDQLTKIELRGSCIARENPSVAF